MTQLRERIAEELARRVRQKGIVVWQDDACQYADVAASVCPEDARFVAFDGSWYAVRRAVEPLLAGDVPPRLVVYASAPAPAEDPLEELRAAGATYRRPLGKLVKDTLAGQLSKQRLAEISSEARTLAEAEAAVDGDGAGDVRLIAVLGTSDARTMALRILTGKRTVEIDAAEAWDAAAELLGRQLGGRFEGSGDDLRRAAFRQLALTELEHAAGGLPDALASAWSPVEGRQGETARELLATWRVDPRHRDGYGDLAVQLDEELRLDELLPWSDGLADCVVTPAVERLALAEAVRCFEAADADGARRLARQRQRTSPWVQPQGPDDLGWAATASRWRAIEATAALLCGIDDSAIPAGASPGELLEWYAESGWTVDRAHRRFEVARNALRTIGALEPAVAGARTAYERWLDATLLAFSAAVERDGFDTGTLARQGDVHATWVRDAASPVAYIWVDALRYELGAELCDGLRADGHAVELRPAVAAAPTVTPVGMANLTPGAGSGLSLALERGALSVCVGGEPVATVADRIARLRAAHGEQVLDRKLDVVAGQGEQELARVLEGTQLVLVRSQELDSAGEAGMLNVAWSQFGSVLELLRNVVARLSQGGVRRIVIAADHGFVTISRGLGPDRAIEPPAGGEGTLNRRAWVGRGAATTASTMRVPLASTGLPTDLDAIVPRGLAVFRAAGSRQFFHGGLSPQELVIPAIVVESEPVPAPKELTVDVSIAGGRITTGAFAATVGFAGNLFTTEIRVRVVAHGPAGDGVVARVVSGDGFDPTTGAVTLRADGTPPVLTFEVTANLDRDAAVEIQVFDARTGVRLGGAAATVAAPIVVEEDLE